MFVGNMGMSPVKAHVGDSAVTFVEMLETGAVQTTTVTPRRAVHSRNTVVSGDLAPTQYYGFCEQN